MFFFSSNFSDSDEKGKFFSFSGLENFLYKFRRGVFGQAKYKTDMEKIVRYIYRDKAAKELTVLPKITPSLFIVMMVTPVVNLDNDFLKSVELIFFI